VVVVVKESAKVRSTEVNAWVGEPNATLGLGDGVARGRCRGNLQDIRIKGAAKRWIFGKTVIAVICDASCAACRGRQDAWMVGGWRY
jgi:hypothetical protein